MPPTGGRPDSPPPEENLGIGTPILVEAGIVLEARLGLDSRAILERLLSDLRIAAVPFGDEHWREATAAFHRYGKGRHPRP